MRRSIGRGVALIATAAAGLLAAHEFDYRLVVPDPTHRHDLLLRTGHGYLARALIIGAAVAVLAGLAAVVTGYRRGEGTAPFGLTFARLALVQSGGFVALEAVERLVVGAPPDDRLPLVTAVGVVVQIVVAWLGARLLAALRATGALVARLRTARPAARAVATSWAIPPGARLARSGSSRPRAIRAPPVPVHL